MFISSCKFDQIKERLIKTTCDTYLDVRHGIVTQRARFYKQKTSHFKNQEKNGDLHMGGVSHPKQLKKRIIKKQKFYQRSEKGLKNVFSLKC